MSWTEHGGHWPRKRRGVYSFTRGQYRALDAVSFDYFDCCDMLPKLVGESLNDAARLTLWAEEKWRDRAAIAILSGRLDRAARILRAAHHYPEDP